ncbi:hypothetical protein A8B78_06125 [Jannaschia sp. EhC01]|nr:hypothetical protein A8B78_06125 [Jannaschia sp. EhC01]
MKRMILTAGLLLAVTSVSGCNLFNSDETVIVPQTYAPPLGRGCVDGFGPIQSGTAICVGASG